MSTNQPADPSYVAGQTGQLLGAVLSSAELAPPREEVLTAAMGALVTFEGVVRDHDGGQRVRLLDYTAHPTAAAELQRVAQEVQDSHPRTRLWVGHRVGSMHIGDVVFVVLAAAAHRGDAYAAAIEMCDRVKAEVPIWKQQELASGAAQWVGVD